MTHMPRRWDGSPVPNVWTESDIATLRALAGKAPTTEIARQLGRSRHATINKAQRLGVSLALRAPARANHGQWWTTDDIATLRRLARTHTQADTARILGRGLPATIRKAGQERIAFRKAGERHNTAKYPTATVRRICQLRALGWGPDRIARVVAVSRGNICNIIYYRGRVREYMGCEMEMRNG